MTKKEKILEKRIIDNDNFTDFSDEYFNHAFNLFDDLGMLILDIPKQDNNGLKEDIVLLKKRKHFIIRCEKNPVPDAGFGAEIKSDKLAEEKYCYIDFKEDFFDYSYIKKKQNLKNFKKILFLKSETKNKTVFFIEMLFNSDSFSAGKDIKKINKFISVFSYAIDYHITFMELKHINKMFEKSLSHILELLISLLEIKDPYTFGHSSNVKKISFLIAEEMNLDESTMNNISIASILHDVGKVGISDIILQKPGLLNEPEFEEVKKHSVKGALLMAHIPKFKNIAKIIMQHHERFDGKGYPMALTGEDIAIEARIIAVADTFDAITSHRPYRSRMSESKAIEIIESESGGQFDPKIVKAFIKAITRNNKDIIKNSRKTCNDLIFNNSGLINL